MTLHTEPFSRRIRQTACLAALVAASTAMAGCSQIASLRPPAGAAQIERGAAELQAGRISTAEAEFETGVKLSGDDYRAVAIAAAVCVDAKQWNLATKYGEIALKRTPRSDRNFRLKAYEMLSAACVGLGDRDRGVQLAKQGYAEYPEEPEAMNLLGYVYADVPVLDKLGEALDLTQRAVKIATTEGRPEDETAMYMDSVGWVKYQQGRVDEAISDLSRASFALSRNSEVLYHLGKSYMKKSRYEDAIVVLERAVKISPRYAEAEQALKEAVDKLPPKEPVPNSPALPAHPDAQGAPPVDHRPPGNNLPTPNP